MNLKAEFFMKHPQFLTAKLQPEAVELLKQFNAFCQIALNFVEVRATLAESTIQKHEEAAAEILQQLRAE